MSDNSLSKTQRVWKATGKLFTDIGYQWRPTGKKLTFGKLDCGSQWRPTGKKFALGEMLTKRTPTKIGEPIFQTLQTRLFSNAGSTGHALVSGLGLLQTYDGESFKAHEFCGKVHRVGQFCEPDLEVAFRKHTCFVRDIKGADILKACQLGKARSSPTYQNLKTTNMEVLHTLHMNPQTKCVVERRNRTLVESSISNYDDILESSDVYYAQRAVATTAYNAPDGNKFRNLPVHKTSGQLKSQACTNRQRAGNVISTDVLMNTEQSPVDEQVPSG
ncbi:hypothetical protein Tco_0313485 [Tanacetum coccineum]